MSSLPPEFTAKFKAGNCQLVSRKLIADLETPVSAFLKLQQQGEPIVLLESVQGGEVRGRYSVIALDPVKTIRIEGDNFEIETGGKNETIKGNPLVLLKKEIKAAELEIPAGLPPMASGLFGFMSYDLVRFMEKLPEAGEKRIDVPEAVFIRPRHVVVFDSVADEITLIALVEYEEGKTPEQKFAEVEEGLNALEARLARQLMGHRATYAKSGDISAAKEGKGKAEYIKMVEAAKEYILAGDIFQVVLSESFESPFYLPHFSLYRAVRHLNPSPFLVYMSFGDFSIVSSSPEIMVRVREGVATIRPIAGTRKRGKTAEEDAELAQDLLADQKELAEHLMLLDLGRNDIGRIAKSGTVKVTEQMQIENYSHVMHIVSNVEGQLDGAKFDALDALVAGFPAGTLSGAPKIRAMEIIAELEKSPRGFYGGAIGYFGAGGDMDTCIAIRTALIKDNMLYTQAGAGVVADSVPESEYQECLNKAKALLHAAAEAERFV